MKTKAAILVELNKDLALEEVEIPKLNYGQVLVKILKTRICGSQLGEIRGVKGEDKYLPHMLGHEAVGKVIDISAGITKVKKYDKVILSWIKSTGINSDKPKYLLGKKIINAGYLTTFNDYAVVSENRLTKVDQNVENNLCLLCADVLATGFGNINNLLKLKPDKDILILGAGGMGLGTILASYLSGANHICSVDLYKFKLENSNLYGANKNYIYEKEFSVDENVLKFHSNNNISFDYVVDFTGNSKLIEFGFKLSKSKGKILLAGVMKHSEQLSINTLDITLGKSIIGSVGGGAFPEEDFDKIIDLVISKKIDIKNFFSHSDNLTKINDLIHKHFNGEVINSYIEMKE